METAKHNLTIKAGATFSKTFALVDENDAIIPLTGYTGSSQIKTSPNGEALATFTVTVDEAGGSFTLALTAAQTKDLAGSNGVYDAFLVSGSDTLCPVQGQAEIIPWVTTL